MTREEQIMNDPSLASYVDKQRGWIHEAFMDGIRWADENRPVDWQQVRIQAAIAAMQLIQTDDIFKRWVQERVEEGGVYYEEYPNIAVEIADHLIVALKQEPWILKENDIKL